MHNSEDASKIATIIGLVFEGIGMFGMLALAAAINVANVLTTDLFIEEGFNQSDAELIVSVLDVLGVVFFVLGGILLVIFMVNLVVFTKLLTGRFNSAQAGTAYLYQIVWGAVNMLFNQVVGIAYLISGIKGRSVTSRADSSTMDQS
jgi:TRAP-type mannitol/chloroaromatic compound transport system permease small subunit